MKWLVAAAILSVVSSPRAQEPQGDLARIQGTWTAEVGPKQIPLAWIVTKDQVRVESKTIQGDAITMTFTIKLDETGEVNHSDATGVVVTVKSRKGEFKFGDSLGLYELKGDELKVCMGAADKPRPSGFVTDGTVSTVVLKREKAEPEPKK